MLRLASLWQEFQQADIAVKRLGDLMDAPAEPYTLTPSRAPGGAGQIVVSGLSFRYSENHPYLYRNLSLALKPGQLTVFSGPSGCGKSTLVKLLQGFYPAEEGRIEIDGRDIRHLSANELRQYLWRGAAGHGIVCQYRLRKPQHGQPARGVRRRDQRLPHGRNS